MKDCVRNCENVVNEVKGAVWDVLLAQYLSVELIKKEGSYDGDGLERPQERTCGAAKAGRESGIENDTYLVYFGQQHLVVCMYSSICLYLVV